MVTVIIPALNEEKTIRQVIRQAKRSELVNEIIVVDDMSTDNTIAEAKKEEDVRSSRVPMWERAIRCAKGC